MIRKESGKHDPHEGGGHDHQGDDGRLVASGKTAADQADSRDDGGCKNKNMNGIRKYPENDVLPPDGKIGCTHKMLCVKEICSNIGTK